MADKTTIEWTDATWNPIRGCTRVSEGCRHCYAESVAARFSGAGQPYEGLARRVQNPNGGSDARWTGEIAIVGGDTLTQPLRWKKPRRIFVNSMSDLFHEAVPDEAIDRIFAIMALCPQHTFQILTKRPERMRAYFDIGSQAFHDRTFEALLWAREHSPFDSVREACEHHGIPWHQPASAEDTWPLRNVWLGVSVENQQSADERIPHLLATPAKVRFLSCEPLLGPVDLRKFMWPVHGSWPAGFRYLQAAEEAGAEVRYKRQALVWASSTFVDWVIVGGESGSHARPMHPDWARAIRTQCERAEVPFFFKQWGEHLPLPGYDVDGVYHIPQDRDIPPAIRQAHNGFGDQVWRRLGKRRAGRTLDHVEHNGFPEV